MKPKSSASLCQILAAAAVAAGTILAPSARAAILVDYNFNAGSGTTVTNAGTLGSAGDGTMQGAATWSTNTPSGTGFSFNNPGGNGDFVKTSNSFTGFNGLTAVTGVLWFDALATPIASDRLMSNYNGATAGFDFLISSAVSSSSYTIRLNVNTIQVSSDASISQSGWTFLAFTYDGTASTNNVNFYVGSTTGAVAQVGSTKNLAGGALGTSAAFDVGDAPSNTNRAPNALFDNVQVYNSVLSQSQLETIRAAAVPEPSTYAMVAGGFAMLIGLQGWRRRRN